MTDMDRQRVVPTHDVALRWLQNRWLSNLTHDLASPLFAARGYARMLLEDREGELSEKQRRYVTSVVQNIERAAFLTRGLKDFPGSDLTIEAVSLSELLRVALCNADVTARDKTVTFVDNIANELICIGDAAKLALALQAFLMAAVEITSSCASIAVSAVQQDESIRIRISSSSAGQAAPDLAAADNILRLHGGTASFRVNETGGFAAEIQLPDASEFEMQRPGGADCKANCLGG